MVFYQEFLDKLEYPTTISGKHATALSPASGCKLCSTEDSLQGQTH
jgi:hypothetical protein